MASIGRMGHLAALCGQYMLALLFLASPAGSFGQSQKMVRIGVITNTSIKALETAQKGFVEALAGAGFKEGVNVMYDRQNSGGDPEKALAIARTFRDDKVDLIHSLGTAATLAVLKVNPNLPVIFSAVTDPVGAGVVPKDGAPGKPAGTNVTGISDRWPVQLQMETYARIVPHAKKWGTIFNPAEPNSAVNIKAIRESATKLGLELVEVAVASSSEVRPAAASLVGRVQAIYIAVDSTVAADIQAIEEVSGKARIAFFTGTAASISRGALAAFGVDYFLVGYAAGKKASLVLKGVDPGSIPWALPDNFGLIINQKAANSLGIKVPADVLKIADQVME
jgi:putative tryptophan/tyrosine transport system substrate-binding protein